MIRKTLLLAFFALAGCGSDNEPATPAATSPPPTADQPAPAPKPPGPVVFIGDSVTAGWNFPPGSEYVNAGVGGEWSQLMLARFEDEVMSLEPSVVHILAGTNDVRIYEDPSLDAVISMAETAASRGACVILGTIPPNDVWGVGVDEAEGNINIDEWNASIKDLAAERGYLLADYHPLLALPDGSLDEQYFVDGIHPNDLGHDKMLEVAEPLIDQCSSSI